MCMPAPPGSYVDSEGAIEATVCVAGGYCPEGSESPTDCPAGHYCTEGAAVPAPCPVGTYSETVGLAREEECLVCPPGQYCDQGKSSCLLIVIKNLLYSSSIHVTH